MTGKAIKTTLPFISALIVSFLLLELASDFLQRTEARIHDKIWQWAADKAIPERRIIIVDIDEKSLSRYGAWPWPRKQLAELVKGIRTAGASLQIFDIIFTARKPDDTLLASELKQQPSVLAQILTLDNTNNLQSGTLIGGLPSPYCQQKYPIASGYIANNPQLANATPIAGHITPRIDRDGIIRRVPAFICNTDNAYPALALAVLSAGIGATADFQLQHNLNWLQSSYHLKHPALPEINIPLNADYDLLIPWWLPRTALTAVSAAEILDRTIAPELLQGAWVIIGSSAFGVGDAITTPQTKIAAGVEVHVQLLAALLDNRLPFHPQGAVYLKALGILLITACMILLLPYRGRSAIYLPPLSGIFLAALCLWLQALLLKYQHISISTLSMMLYALLSGCFLALNGYLNIWQENRRLYKNLSSYLPEQAAKRIATHDPVSTIAAHHEQVFVMYADLRNFSNWCEQLPAEQVGAILHSFYKLATITVNQHGGQTEKYIGDAVLAVWRQHDTGILPAAQQLLHDIEQLFGEQPGNLNLPPLGLGIGIEKGEILAGSFGPAQRREYTILGKTVSTAIQLQEMTTELALPILIGEKAARQWQPHIQLETQGKFMLTGRVGDMEIFTPA